MTEHNRPTRNRRDFGAAVAALALMIACAPYAGAADRMALAEYFTEVG